MTAAEAEAQAIASSKEAFCEARKVIALFDRDFLHHAISRYLRIQTGDSNFHPAVRSALLPHVINLAIMNSDQTLDQLIASLRLARVRDARRRGLDSLHFHFGEGSKEQHTASAHTRLQLCQNDLVPCATRPISLSDLAKAARAASDASVQFARSFALLDTLILMNSEWERLDLTAFSGAVNYPCDWTASGVVSFVRDPRYFLRLMRTNAVHRLSKSCDQLMQRLRRLGDGDILDTITRRKLIGVGKGGIHVYPSDKKVNTRTLLADEAYNLICIIHPEVSTKHHWDKLEQQRNSKEVPFEEARTNLNDKYSAASSESYFDTCPKARLALRISVEAVLSKFTDDYGAERANAALSEFSRHSPRFRDHLIWKQWECQSVRAIQQRVCDPAETARLEKDFKLFVSWFSSEFERTLRALQPQQEIQDE